MKAAKKILSLALVALMVFAALPPSARADDPVCSIGEVPYTNFNTALNEVPEGGTITMAREYHHDSQIAVRRKSFTIDLNGFTLNVSCSVPAKGALDVDSGSVDITGGGALNVTNLAEGGYGVRATFGGKATVTSATANAGYGAHAMAGGSKATVLGNASGKTGASVSYEGSVEIRGSVSGANLGIEAAYGGEITVKGSVFVSEHDAIGVKAYLKDSTGKCSRASVEGDVRATGNGATGIRVEGGGSANVKGNVAASGVDAKGVFAVGDISAESTAYVDGVISVPQGTYIDAGSQIFQKNDGVPDGSYLSYSAYGSSVYVKITTSATLDPTAAAFDKNPERQADVTTAITWNGAHSVTDVKAGGSSIGAANYSVSGSTLTIKKEYLAAKAVGSLALSVEFDDGGTATLGIAISDTAPVTRATLSPTAAAFDKSPTKQADVTATIAWNSASSVTDVKAGGSSIGTANYSVSGSTLTIKKEYLATRAVGSLVLTVAFDKGGAATLAITISDTTKSATLSPTTGTFDKDPAKQADVTTAITWNDARSVADVKAGVNSIGATNYSVSGTTLTIKKTYLSTLAVGSLVLTVSFDHGGAATLNIAISDTTPIASATISPTAGTFDKDPAKQADVTTTITWNDARSVADVKAGLNSIGATNYSVSGTTLTIKKTYLATLAVGSLVLTVSFDKGAAATLVIAISDTEPITSATISPKTGAFDKDPAKQADVTATVIWNSARSVTDVRAGGSSIGAGSYSVSGTTLAIKKAYLAERAVGSLVLTVIFDKGAAATLTITISDTTPVTSATISPATGAFDKDPAKQAGVTTTVTWNSARFVTDVKLGETSIGAANYVVIGDTLAIKREYLAEQAVGSLVLTVIFDKGSTATLTITISDTTPIVSASLIPTAPAFDKNPAKQADVAVAVTWNSARSVTDVKAGETSIGTDAFSVSGNTLTIKKEYLVEQAVGSLALSVEFDKGGAATLSVNIFDTTPADPACAIGSIGYATLEEALDAATGAATTIKLLKDIEYRTASSIVVTGKSVYFDLNGHKLDVISGASIALEVGAGGVVDVMDTSEGRGGAFNLTCVETAVSVVYAHGGGQATATNATVNTEFGVAAQANGGGSRVVILGNAAGDTGACAYNFGVVNINGNVTSSHLGARAEGGGAVTVYGSVAVEGTWVIGVSSSGSGSQVNVSRDVTVNGDDATGVLVTGAGTAKVLGSVSVGGTKTVGVDARDSNSTAYVDGALSVADYGFYIITNSDPWSAKDGVPEESYLCYSDGMSSVYVTAPAGPVCEIGTTPYDTLAEALVAAIDEAADGAATTIRLLRDADYEGGIRVSGKTVVFDLNGHALGVTNVAGNGLEVGAGGVVDIADTSAGKDGEFSVMGMGYGVYAHDGGRATVSVAIGMAAGAVAADGGSIRVMDMVAGLNAFIIASGGGAVTVEGMITGSEDAVYIRLGEAIKNAGDCVLGAGANKGYLVYSDALGNIVRVATRASCMVGAILYESFGAALEAVGAMPEGAEATVKLLRDIAYIGGIKIEGRTVTFDLNGCALDVTNADGHGLEVGAGGAVLLAENGAGGEFNVTSAAGGHGVYAHDGGRASVTAAAASGSGCAGACAKDALSAIEVTGNANSGLYFAAYAFGGGAVIVGGDAQGVLGAGVEGGGSVEVKGGVASAGYGVYVVVEGSVRVHKGVAVSGGVELATIGVLVHGSGSTVFIGGDVTVSAGTGAIGVLSTDGGTTMIEGVLSAPEESYIALATDPEGPEDMVFMKAGDGASGTAPYHGYTVYADGSNLVCLRIQSGAALSPTAAFDKNPSRQADVTSAIAWNGARAVTDVKANGASIGAANYSVSGNTLMIKKAYLAAQAVGSLVLSVEFDKYDAAALTITISDTTPSGGGSPFVGRTLSDAASGVAVSGNGIHEQARLIVTPIGTRSLPDALKRAAGNGALIAGFEVSLTGGGFRGVITISFPVSAQYNGRRVTVLHSVNGKVEAYSALVMDGRVTIAVNSLSPFAILLDTGAVKPPSTGGAAREGGLALIGLAALLAYCALHKRRRT